MEEKEERRKQQIEKTVYDTLEKISEITFAEFLEPVLRYVGDRKVYEEEDRVNLLVPFLVWMHKQKGVEERQIFNYIFAKPLSPQLDLFGRPIIDSNRPQFISSTDALKALYDLLSNGKPNQKVRNLATKIFNSASRKLQDLVRTL